MGDSSGPVILFLDKHNIFLRDETIVFHDILESVRIDECSSVCDLLHARKSQQYGLLQTLVHQGLIIQITLGSLVNSEIKF